jgi:putative lipoic acid-binding regulatory protein
MAASTDDPTDDPTDAGPAPARDSLIDFPSLFPIKVMGTHVEGFEDQMLAVVRMHDEGFDPARIERRPSKGGRYLGLTLTITATSREQLDALYRALSSHPLVKVVL